ncbi:MAG: hypothetical protein AB7U75_04400 [Hyphomicrobiaceae bacterium]
MFLRSFRSTIGALIIGAGWLSVLAGLVAPAMLAADVLTTEAAVATVTQVRTGCQRLGKTRSGYKRWLRVDCAAIADLEAAGARVRSKQYAKLSFIGADGIARTATAGFTTIKLTTAQVGDPIAIRYRGRTRPYVTIAAQPEQLAIGFAITVVGLLFVGLGRGIRPRTATLKLPAPAHVEALRTYRGHEETQGAPNSSRVLAVPALSPSAPARPARVSSVQRASGWFR